MVLSNIRIPVGQQSVGLILSSYICEVEGDMVIILSDEHIESGWFAPKVAAGLLSFKYPPEFVEKLVDLD